MKFAPLFTIEIVHDYFSVSKPDLLRIVPTAETKNILRGAGLIAKFKQNKLYVFTRYTGNFNPLVALSNNFKLQFFLEITGFNFGRITNYKNENPYYQKLFFSNAISILDGDDKSIENALYLHEKLPIFNSANAYFYNDLVRSGSDIAYECLVNLTAGSGNLNNNSHFRQLEKISYVTQNSSLLFTGAEQAIKLETPASSVIITYNRYNSVTKAFDIQVKQENIGVIENPSGIPVNEVMLQFYNDDGKSLDEGIYMVQINAQQEFLYFRPTNDWQPYLGLINIHNDEFAANTSYRFIKEDGTFYTIAPDHKELETRNYIIRFAPAQYLLKYVCRSNKVTDISDEDGNIVFDNLGGNVFRSQLPVRMNEQPIDSIKVAYNGSEDLKKTKIPGHQQLSLLDDDKKYMISETYLNL